MISHRGERRAGVEACPRSQKRVCFEKVQVSNAAKESSGKGKKSQHWI